VHSQSKCEKCESSQNSSQGCYFENIVSREVFEKRKFFILWICLRVREVVASDPLLFNFPAKVQFLPPVFGLSPMVVASDQEHRLAAINAALTADITQPPWIVTKILVFGQY
jgi:hypothetical protein